MKRVPRLGSGLLLPAVAVYAFGASLAGAEGWRDRLYYGGEVTFNASPKDPGYFNQATYTANALRLFRLSLQLEYGLSQEFAVATEIRSDNLDEPTVNALYLRIRPWRERAFAVQIGRISPVFGGFGRRRYTADNPLIGYPLAYQYPTLVRPDAAARDLAELRAFRGRGGKPRYDLGGGELAAGLAIIDPFRWDTGVQVQVGDQPVSLSLAVTQGTLGNPRVEDDNEGKQLAGRLALRPSFGLKLAGSFAYGDYVSDHFIKRALVDPAASKAQTSFGGDLEWSRGHWLVRSEGIWSRWDSPNLGVPLSTFAVFGEVKRQLRPDVFVAGRVDRMTFSHLEVGGERFDWDSPITRTELGLGFRPMRHLQTKLTYQYNKRDAGKRTSVHLVSAQVYVWW